MAKKWSRREFELPRTHGWRTTRPGNKIFVADRGAVQFEFPASWIVDPGPEGSIRLRDKPEPDDSLRLEVSVIQHHVQDDRAPRGYRAANIDWSDLPLAKLLLDVTARSERRDVTERGQISEARRRDLEVAWYQIEFMDPGEKRKAYSRLCLARGRGVHSFITLEFWPEDASLANRVWRGVLATLKLGEYISDPTQVSRMN